MPPVAFCVVDMNALAVGSGTKADDGGTEGDDGDQTL